MSNRVGPVIWRVVPVALCIVGGVAAGLLSDRHVGLMHDEASLLSRLCADGDTVSCDEVLQSEWAKLGGFPVSLLGLFFFTAIGLWYLVVGVPSRERRAWQLVPIVACAFGAADCLYLAFVMFTKLEKLCPWCLTTHVATVLLLIGSMLAWPRRRRAEGGSGAGGGAFSDGERAAADTASVTGAAFNVAGGREARPLFGRVLVTALLVVAVVALEYREFTYRVARADADSYKAAVEEFQNDREMLFLNWVKEEKHEIEILPENPMRGQPDAKHTVVVFSDLACPQCFQVAERVDAWFGEPIATGNVRVVFKHYPLNRQCNRGIKGSPHPGACWAAWAAEAARLQGGSDAFWKMHDKLFAFKGRFKPADLNRSAREIGLDMQRFKQDMTDLSKKRLKNVIDADIASGIKLGLKGTPGVYLDGRRVRNWRLRNFWVAAIKVRPAPEPATPQVGSQ